MKSLLCLVAVGAMSLTAFAADTNAPSPGPTNPCLIRPGSGVEGTADRGPVQPVAGPGQKNTAPIVGARIVVLKNGKQVATTKTDKNGHYSLDLKPGKYTLVGPRGGIPPRAFRQEIEVKNGWQKLDIHIDTGIRTPMLPPVKPAVQRQVPNGGGVALPVVHKIDLGGTLPNSLTVKAGEQIVFEANVPGARMFAGWQVAASDSNKTPLVTQLKKRIHPPVLYAERAGKGELEIFYTHSPKGVQKSHTIKLTVLK